MAAANCGVWLSMSADKKITRRSFLGMAIAPEETSPAGDRIGFVRINE